MEAVQVSTTERSFPGVVLLTPERLRLSIGAHLDGEWATAEFLAQAGLDVAPEKLEETLFAFDGKDLAKRKVKYELHHITMTVPETGIIYKLPEAFFVENHLKASWGAKTELMRTMQPQAVWGCVAATITDRTDLVNEVVPVGPYANVNSDPTQYRDRGDGIGETVNLTPGARGTMKVQRTEIVVEAVYVDLSMSDLIDPNLGKPGYVGGSSPMAAYVDSGRVYRMMPTGMRKHRERALATTKAFVAGKLAAKKASVDALAALVAGIDPNVVVALRKAGLSDTAIAANLRIPEAALSRFPKPPREA